MKKSKTRCWVLSDPLKKLLPVSFLFFILQLFPGFIFSQVSGDYRTRVTGNWNSNSTWQVFNGSTWVNCGAGNYPGVAAGAGTVDIRDNHTVTITANVPNPVDRLRINGGTNDSYLQFNPDMSLTVTGQTYLNSTSNNDEKSVLVDAGTFFTGSLVVNSNGDNRDAYLRISTGNVTVTGDIDLNSSNLRTYILFTGNGNLYIGGAIAGGTITSTSGGGAASPTSGNVIYNGPAAQVIGSYSYYDLTINNTSGVSISGNITVSNILTMTAGNLTTGTNTLILSSNEPGSLDHTSGTIIGRLRRTISTTLSNDYLFPLGTSSFYRPATMNFSALASEINITAEFTAFAPDGFTGYTDDYVTLTNLFSEGYWRFISSALPAASYTVDLSGNGFTSYTINDLTRITGRDNGNNTWRAMGTHGSRSGNEITRAGVTNLNTTSFDFALASGCSQPFLGYSYERNIVIDNTQVEGSSDLFNFPMMVRITGANFLMSSPAGRITSPGGYDIIFTDNEYNKLDHQIEYYDGSSGTLIAWVRIPVLYTSANTTIKILYGNPAITTDPSVTTVWDSHYRGIWHLDNVSLKDFTIYDKPGTAYNSPTYPGGVIDNSLGLNGSNQYVQVVNDPAINFAGNITVSAWVYMNAASRDQKIAGNQNGSAGGYKFGIYTNNKVEFEIRNSANNPSLNRDVAGGTVLSTGQWYYLAGVSSDVLDSIKTFVNGIQERPFKKTGILGTASNNLIIGREPFESLYFFSGRFDEIRISNSVRSNGWMRAEYNNQRPASTFYSIDAAETLSGTLPSESICNGPITLTFGFPAGGTYSGNPYISGDVFTPPSAGTYTINYTYNGCGPVTKDFIITDIPEAPAAPDRSYCISQIAWLSATTGENIQWYYGGSPVSTANPFSTGRTTAGTYNYTVTQSLNGCESPATPVVLNIYSGINITSQPQAAVICQGGNASFSVAAGGYNLTYRWQEDGVNITDGGIYSGATSQTLVLTNPGPAKNGKRYRCVVSSSCGPTNLNSSQALLTINPLPVATFNYPANPYCPNGSDPFPVFTGGGVAGTFSSTPGLVFISTSTGQVDLSASTPGDYTVTNTIIASGGCSEVIATSPLSITASFTWSGAAGTNWNNPGNWICGMVPSQANSVIIPDVPNKPVLGIGFAGAVNNLTINSGSSLVISGNTLAISGSIVNNGTLTAGSGSVLFNGSAPQIIGASVFNGNTITNLSVNNPAGVTLLGELKITGIVRIQSGDLASGGFLTLSSSAGQTAVVDGAGSGTISGNVAIQRYFPSSFGYKYVCSPLQAATVGDFGDEVDLGAAFPSFFRYDENLPVSGWVEYTTPSAPLNPLEGYAAFLGESGLPLTGEVKGVLNSGPLSVTLYNHNNTYTQGFNLVGNPYPSPVDWDAPSGWTKINIDNALYYFKAGMSDPYGGQYSTYVNGISSDDTVSNVIPSMQGFFVHVSDGTGTFPVTGILGLDNTVRINDLTHDLVKSEVTAPASVLRLKAGFEEAGYHGDPTVIYFDEKGSAGFDPGIDALKLMNTDNTVPSLYSLGTDGKKLSINALPEISSDMYQVPLGLSTQRDGNVVFRIPGPDNDLSGYMINLYDQAAGVEHDLLNGQPYTVFLNAGNYNYRFWINLYPGATEITDEFKEDHILSVFSSGGFVKGFIDTGHTGPGILSVHSLTGHLHFVKRITDPGYFEFDPGVKNGIYIITFDSGKFRSSKKLFIQDK